MATFIRPEAVPDVLQDEALINAFQETVVGVTGLVAQMVRPSWQITPANLPDFSQNWASLGLTATDSDVFAYQRQISAEEIELERDQTLRLLMSFYGPTAQMFSGLFRDGIQIEFNRFALGAIGVKLVETGSERHLPALVKDVYQQRYDLPSTWRRRIRRIYKLAAVDSAQLGLDNEYYITPIIVNPPTP